MASGQIRTKAGQVKVRVVEGRNLRGFGADHTSSPFVTVTLREEEKHTHAGSLTQRSKASPFH